MIWLAGIPNSEIALSQVRKLEAEDVKRNIDHISVGVLKNSEHFELESIHCFFSDLGWAEVLEKG